MTRLLCFPKGARADRLGAAVAALALTLAVSLLVHGGARAEAPGASSLPGASVAAVREDPDDYKIGLFDKLSITVFGVKELALDSVQVDASGQIQLPLIGSVMAKGKTSRQLSSEIAASLNARYLRDAQVSVTVAASANEKVTVEGAVTDAGVFEIPGKMTLLQAVALAKGPTNRADLRHVAIFRTVEGRRNRLTYDLLAIQAGRNDDPEMLGNDVVVVSESTGLAAFREVVGDVGAFAIFSIFR
jgi:polysaccharide export outer membrane protein